jgi:alpha-2-macroglobulin
VDDPSDVRRTADGGWEVRAGARVRVRLSMVVPERRYQVALVDPLPAGFEAINPDLGGTGSVSDDLDWRGWRWWWYNHEAFRDERVELFGTTIWPGVYDYAYIARATTPGSFVAPPAKAEEMYAPETFGRSGTDRVVVR